MNILKFLRQLRCSHSSFIGEQYGPGRCMDCDVPMKQRPLLRCSRCESLARGDMGGSEILHSAKADIRGREPAWTGP